MTGYPSRAVLTTARLIQRRSIHICCPECCRLARLRPAPFTIATRLPTLRRRLHYASTVNPTMKENDFDVAKANEADLSLDNSTEKGNGLVGFEETSIVPQTSEGSEPSGSLKQIEESLQFSELDIEELEDGLLDVDISQSSVTVPSEREIDQPWYMRQEGDISAEEYAEIENMLNSNRDEEQPVEAEEEDTTPTSNEEESNVLPWYLREQQESEYSLLPKIDLDNSKLEKYPDLPVDSPPLLQPLVSRLFYDHHLQNIILLDLRNRDPPPFWGSNTIMILATARGERHLQSVAEVTSKWLKSTLGVVPRIDGLPRKESLVIKRRRLRKKSLRKPGYMITAPKQTEWVSMYTGYQGLVLQLFTEQGRQEYDLEGLWGDSRIVDAAELDMKPRKMKLGVFEDDPEVRPKQTPKKSILERAAEKERRKWEKMKEQKAAKKRWTKQEKEVAKQRRAQEAVMFNMANHPLRSQGRPKIANQQQSRQFHGRGMSI